MRPGFLLDPDVTYLNHGSYGACPVEVFEAYQRWQRELETDPHDFFTRRFDEELWNARAALAALVGGRVDDLVFVPNATSGLNAVIPAARAVLDGQSPYPAPDHPVGGYVYPPQLALLLTPLTFVTDDVAVLFAVLVSVGLLISSLAVLGVRDIRCYAVIFLWAPTWNQLDMGSVSAGLVFALALAWRYRDHALPQALALGLAIPAKLFLWPLLVWTLATGRIRATILSVATGLVVTATAWADHRIRWAPQLRRVTTHADEVGG